MKIHTDVTVKCYSYWRRDPARAWFPSIDRRNSEYADLVQVAVLRQVVLNLGSHGGMPLLLVPDANSSSSRATAAIR